MGITSPSQLEPHHHFGNIIENALIVELYKKRTNAGKRPRFWFWQDQKNNEVDLLIEEDGRLKAVEIKSSQTYNSRLVSGLKHWQKLTGSSPENQYLVYAGDQEGELEYGQLLSWRSGIDRV